MTYFRSKAFTLIETIVVVTLTTFILITLSSLIRYFYITNAYVLEQSQAVNSARRSIQNALSDFRGASYAADGSYPIQAVGTSTAIFFANIDSDTAIEKVRYYLQGSTLYRGTTDPAGSPPAYAGQTEKITLVIDNIRNGTTPLFTYYDSTGAELIPPINLSKIASVRTLVLTDVNANRAPNVYTLTGSATLRNIHNLNSQ